MAVQRAALVDLVLQGEGQDEGDVLRMLQRDGVHAEGDVLALRGCAPAAPGVQEGAHPWGDHLLVSDFSDAPAPGSDAES